jgi:hypothetical protein
MVGGRVQRVETMPFVLDLRTVLDGEPHAAKNRDRALEHLRQRMQMANRVTPARQRDVDRRARPCAVFASNSSRFAAMAAVSAFLISLASLPMRGFSSFGSLPSCSSAAEPNRCGQGTWP